MEPFTERRHRDPYIIYFFVIGWAISEASGSAKVKLIVCLFVCEHDNLRTRRDTAFRFKTWWSMTKTSAAIEIQYLNFEG